MDINIFIKASLIYLLERNNNNNNNLKLITVNIILF